VRPTYFPSVPRIFEKLYTLATASVEDPAELKAAVQLGLKVRLARARGEEVPAELMEPFEQADGALYKRSVTCSGRIRNAVTGAARSRGDPRVSLPLRRAGARGLRDD